MGDGAHHAPDRPRHRFAQLNGSTRDHAGRSDVISPEPEGPSTGQTHDPTQFDNADIRDDSARPDGLDSSSTTEQPTVKHTAESVLFCQVSRLSGTGFQAVGLLARHASWGPRHPLLKGSEDASPFLLSQFSGYLPPSANPSFDTFDGSAPRAVGALQFTRLRLPRTSRYGRSSVVDIDGNESAERPRPGFRICQDPSRE